MQPPPMACGCRKCMRQVKHTAFDGDCSGNLSRKKVFTQSLILEGYQIATMEGYLFCA